jgi:general secretion pathway protein D
MQRAPARRFVASICVFALTCLSGQAQQPPAVPQPKPAAPPPAAAPQPPPQQPAVPQPAPPAPAPTGATVGPFNLNNVSLLEVINELTRELHINYVLDASIKGAGSVTVNTFGAIRDVDLRPLLETILRMNNLAMVQVGNLFRIVPVANVARQPISPIHESDASKLPEDERMMLNLIFLRYATSSEMVKVLTPFTGDGGQISNYDPANLLIVLDNSRNMRRTLELIAMFDSDTFAGQRVRSFEVSRGRPSDIANELNEIFKAYAFSTKERGAVQFLPLDRINTILAVSPNPGVFAEVEKWIAKLDITAKFAAGSIQNNVYRLKYGRAEILGSVVVQLYGGCAPGGGYGGPYGIPGNSSYPSAGYAGGSPYGNNIGASPYGGGVGAYSSSYGGANGASPYQYGGAPGGYGSPYAYGGAGGYGGYGANCGGYAPAAATGYGGTQANPLSSVFSGAGAAPPASGSGTTGNTRPQTGAGADQTGTYLGENAPSAAMAIQSMPRIIPNPYDNTLLVQSTPEQWEQIRSLLDQLDISPRQVLIDAKIYEVDLTGTFSAGVEAFLQRRGATNSAGITSTQLLGSSNASASAQTILSAGTLVGQSRELLAMLQFQEGRTRAKVLSAPSVIATDSIPASITIGDSVPTLTSQAINAGVTSGGNSLFTQTISNTSTGIGLNILARVNSSGIVTMVINQAVTAPEPNPAGTNINSPSFSQRNVSTQVNVQDGDTIAIGGIISESTTDTSSGIPFLDRIPYLGAAFGNKTSTKTRQELIIFLTPRVIYDTNQVAEATQELRDKVKGLRKIIGNQ